jgi:equilibrative nucleoside transporter 1/2/3
VFPAITSTIQSVQGSGSLSNPFIFSAIHFLVFNVGDWVGRYLCSFPALQVWAASQLVYLSFLRVLFIPILLACNIVPPKSLPSSSPFLASMAEPVIASDASYLLILLLFGITNGHLGSSCMMAAPSLEHNRRLKREEVDSAAVVAGFCLTAGLFLGGAGSFLVGALVGE